VGRPTAKALRLVGLEVRAWSFVIPQLAHVHAVGIVRLALEPSIPAGGRWLSERELRREAGKSHAPDAAVQLPDDPTTEALTSRTPGAPNPPLRLPRPPGGGA
jgi:hypothetical protein